MRWVFAILLAVVGLSGCGSGGGDGTDAGASASAQEAASRRYSSSAPTVPTDLSAEAVSSAQIDLSWSPSTDNRGVASYTVRRNGSRIATVTDDTSYEDTGLAPRTAYSYTVEAVDLAGNVSGQSAVATATTRGAETTPPTVSSTSPANNATAIGVNSAIKVTFSETILKTTVTSATFKLATRAGAAVSGTISTTSNGATFTPLANLAANTQYTATITTGVTDAAGNHLRANFAWGFTTSAGSDSTLPKISSVSPFSGRSGIPLNATVSATFSKAMSSASLTSSSFRVVRTSGGTVVGGKVTLSGTTATFTPSANLASGAQYTATVTTAAKDTAGNALAANYPWTFTTATTVNTTPPQVISTSPATSATGIALNSSVTATFSEEMTASTLTASTFKLTTAAGAAVTGTVTVSGSSAAFKPQASLVAGAKYTATITTAAKDSTGTAMAANYTWTFTTAAALDTTPPVVSTGSPSSGATNVAVTTPISATFSEAMENSTLTTATFLVTKSTGAAVAGTVKISGNTATFTPSAALAASSQYTATITTGATDASDNELARNFAWSFTTAASSGGTGGGGTTPPPTATACSNSTGQPKLAVAATRTTGVAPLAVFFNTAGTTSPVTARPFHEVEYRWDFGDATSGNWAYGSRAGSSSRNVATGPVAGHVFETVGTHTITVTAVDGTNTSSCNMQVTVTDPNTVFAGSSTICFAASGNFTGCPAGSTNVTTSDFDSAVNSYKGTNRRLLFHRGDTFSASASSSITVTGPGLIGAYGTGAKPIVNASGVGSEGVISFGAERSPNTTANLKDWRVMDLSFNGGGNSEVIAHNGGFDQLTYLRVDATRCGDACFMFNGDILSYYDGNGSGGHHVWTEVAIADSTLSIPSTWSLYLWAKNFSVLGNSFDNQGSGSHTVRIIAGINGVISNNSVARNGTSSPAGNHLLKFHAPTFTGTPLFPAGTYSENVVISDNKFTPSSASVNNWSVSIDPQDSSENERMRNIIFERNWMTAGTNTSIGVSVQATEMTLRNNLYNGTGGATAIFTEISKRSSGAAAPTNIWIYNNTMYSSSNNVSSGEPFISVTSSAVSGGTTVKNNLGYAPSASSGLVSAILASLSTNNSTNAQLRLLPGFVSSALSVPTDFALTATSYARNAGAAVPVFSDFFRQTRTPGSVDMGFDESP